MCFPNSGFLFMPFFSIFVHQSSTIRKQIPLYTQMPIIIRIQGYLYYFNFDNIIIYCYCSVIKSYLTLPLHGLQHSGIHCPSPSPRVCSNSCPFSEWFDPTISSSVMPFSSCPQPFPASRSFLMSQLFTSGGDHPSTILSAEQLTPQWQWQW